MPFAYLHLEGSVRQRIRNGSLYGDHIVFWNGNTSLLLVAQAERLRFSRDQADGPLLLDNVRIPHHFNSVYHSLTESNRRVLLERLTAQ